MNTLMTTQFAATEPVTRGARARDAAFAAAYEEHHRRALRFAGLLYGNSAKAEDAVADAFARIWRRYRAGANIDAMWPYLRTSLVNGFNKGLRRKYLEQREEARLANESIAVQLPQEGALDDRAVLMAALDQLSPRQRAAIVLRFFDDCSEADTAAALGCSVGTVKASVSRGLARMRDILEPASQEGIQ